MLGLALLGGMSRLLNAAPLGPAAGDGNIDLDRELAAIVADPACQLASLSVLAIRHGKIQYEQQFGRRLYGAPPGRPTPAPCTASPRFPR